MAVSTDDFSFVADYLRKVSAISLAPGKEYLVESRLATVARDGGFKTVGELIGHLRVPVPNPKVTNAVVEAMTTNETSFFRDRAPFEALSGTLIPEILKRNTARRTLSIWSAASSTGQELYSIAMLLDTHFPELASWNVRLYGTDLSHEVVARARAGVFSTLEANRGLSAPMLETYFERKGAQYALIERIRRQCEFERMNLAAPWPALPRFDVVFCRNVLIYFDLDVRQQILARMRRVLVPGGVLFLGTAETTVGVAEGYSIERFGTTTVFRPKD